MNLLRSDRRKIETLVREGSCDLSHAIPRIKPDFGSVSFHKRIAKASSCVNFRSMMPTVDQMGFPMVFKKMAREKNGIIFFTGATGSRKDHFPGDHP